ncbi:hypothetical protein [Ruegeria arenilitoris]|uniref:hypothetical protein n=1 Tax=Ruegeria arenilitoris TaxID=1173585 RepID=UPI00147DE62B|nr:hypothetical protein [Ruegeria arenilitoris]
MTEVAGARCKVQSKQLRATVVTPQIVRVPKFKQTGSLPNRGRPENLLISCNLDNKKGSTDVFASRHPSEAYAMYAGESSSDADTAGPNGGVAVEIGTFIGNAINRQLFLAFAWTYLYSGGDVALE